MTLIVWSIIIAIVICVPVFAGRPEGIVWSEDRRALRALRRMHREGRP